MSERLGTVDTRGGQPIDVGRFHGGRQDGPCVQLTPTVPIEHLQLTREGARQLVELLERFLEQTSHPRDKS